MPGRSGRNKHSVLVDLTETNLAAHRVAYPAKKQSVDHWLDHVALPPALKKKKRELLSTSRKASALPAREGLLDWFARSMVEIVWWLLGLAVVRMREGGDGAGEEGTESRKSGEKKMRGKRWYH